MAKKNKRIMDIDNTTELISYLNLVDDRLKYSKNVCHYTTLPVLEKIIDSKKWHLGNPKNMNDKLEYESVKESYWGKIFLSSFMMEEKENMGMWSMYAQPWESGIKITIPTKDFKKWIKGIKEIIPIKKKLENDNEYMECDTIECKKDDIKIIAVAYYDEPIVKWSNRKIKKKLENIHSALTTGYIKDMAWSYEKEIRIMANVSIESGVERLAIDLPTSIIEAMTITAGPKFEGDLSEKIKGIYKSELKVDKSNLYGKFEFKTICESCCLKKNTVKDK